MLKLVYISFITRPAGVYPRAAVLSCSSILRMYRFNCFHWLFNNCIFFYESWNHFRSWITEKTFQKLSRRYCGLNILHHWIIFYFFTKLFDSINVFCLHQLRQFSCKFPAIDENNYYFSFVLDVILIDISAGLW